ncbi:TIGR03067 domain-containing protein [Pseudomonas brenneri]
MSSPPSRPMPCPTELDNQALQGTWEQIALEDSGIANPPDEHSAPGALTTIEGDRFRVMTQDGKVLLEGRFTLDASTTPKSITWIDAIGADAGKSLPASYTLDDEHFVFIAADEGMPRPTRFRTTSGQTMRTFVRKS